MGNQSRGLLGEQDGRAISTVKLQWCLALGKCVQILPFKLSLSVSPPFAFAIFKANAQLMVPAGTLHCKEISIHLGHYESVHAAKLEEIARASGPFKILWLFSSN